jgi:hypothetical protein
LKGSGGGNIEVLSEHLLEGAEEEARKTSVKLADEKCYLLRYNTV